MQLPENCAIARIYLGESDTHKGKPLSESIVLAARKSGLAGATVFRGSMGFGQSSRLHTTKILRLSSDLPIVVEIIDSPEKIESFLPEVKLIVGDGLITVEAVRVVHYKGSARTD